MEAYQERVFIERDGLRVKIEGLNTFIDDRVRFDALPGEEKLLLQWQLEVMRAYLHVLDRRIARFV